jgi:hypothetical protein
MNAMPMFQKFVVLAGLGLATASCGDVVRDGRAPVFLVIESLRAQAGGPDDAQPTGYLLSDVQTMVREPEPCTAQSPCPTVFNDSGIATFRISPKNIGVGATPTEPTSNNEVTITRYRVEYRRSDGRNTPGVDVPYGFDGAATGTVPASGKLDLHFELVRHAAKGESPLVQLITSPRIITTIADVTFYGRDQVGNTISASGSIQVDFGNFGDQ